MSVSVVFKGDEKFLKPVQVFGGVTVSFEKDKAGKFVAKDVPERIAKNMAMNPLYVIESDKPIEVHEFKVEPNPVKERPPLKVPKTPLREKNPKNTPSDIRK